MSQIDPSFSQFPFAFASSLDDRILKAPGGGVREPYTNRGNAFIFMKTWNKTYALTTSSEMLTSEIMDKIETKTADSEALLLAIPFRTVDNLDTRVQRPRARPPFTNPFRSRSRCHQATPSTTADFRSAPSGTSFSESGTSSCSPNFVELPRWLSRAAWSLAVPQRGQKALREPSVITSPGLCCAFIVAACCWLRSPKALTETRN